MHRALLIFALAAGSVSGKESFEKSVRPLVAKSCLACHSAQVHAGGLNLEQFTRAQDVLAQRATWESVLEKLRRGLMPPKGAPRPQDADVKLATSWIQSEFDRADKHAPQVAGRVTVRRLNRYEYNNTVRDLLAVDFHPSDDFPADDSGYGFDNIGDVLSLSPLLMEKYLHAAEKIAKVAIPSDTLPKPTVRRYPRSENRATVKGPGLTIQHEFTAEGDYNFLMGVNGRPDPLKIALSVDATSVETPKLESAIENRRTAELRIHLKPGEHVVQAELIADGDPLPDPPINTDGKKATPPPAAPTVSYVEIRGPYNPIAPPPGESYRRVFSCGHAPGQHTFDCVRRDIGDLARLAFRRPVTEQETDRLAGFVAMAQRQGDDLDQAMRVSLAAILVSPHFLFRVERDPAAAGPHRINEFELATRLSYFLWSSMPDEELFRLAARRRLSNTSVLEAQIRRMLRDPKSQALVENFGGQWLQLRNLDSIKPDPDRFPMFNDELRRAMKQETQLFFASIVRENRSILDFLDAGYTFLNEPLAKFYGVSGVEGGDFRRVELPGDSHRGGILTQASVLTVSSYAARTSPVIRGKWILENILNAPPPPPPADVPNLDEKAIGTTETLRRQLEQHRADPTCNSCHSRMDPLGFGLENYDAIGRWRTHDGNFPIDARGALPNGQAFEGPDGLRSLLRQDKDAFAECLTAKLLTYALGRGVERYDRPTIQSITRRTSADGYKFSRLIQEIVTSKPFQMRGGT